MSSFLHSFCPQYYGLYRVSSIVLLLAKLCIAWKQRIAWKQSLAWELGPGSTSHMFPCSLLLTCFHVWWDRDLQLRSPWVADGREVLRKGENFLWCFAYRFWVRARFSTKTPFFPPPRTFQTYWGSLDSLHGAVVLSCVQPFGILQFWNLQFWRLQL